MTPSGLEGRVALVTGGSQGIGREVAGTLAAAGAVVVAASRSAVDVKTRDGRTVHGHRLDASDPEACAATVAHCQDRFGSLDIVVHSAGIAESVPFLQLTRQNWSRHLALDVEAAVWLVQAALPAMIERGHGRVVSIGSLAGHLGFPYVTSYVAAKHALVGITRSWAVEFARSGVTFNCVSPYYVDTSMVESAISVIADRTGRPQDDVRAAMTMPNGRLVDVAEVAATCLHLCSDQARSISGQSIRVDGGYGNG